MFHAITSPQINTCTHLQPFFNTSCFVFKMTHANFTSAFLHRVTTVVEHCIIAIDRQEYDHCKIATFSGPRTFLHSSQHMCCTVQIAVISSGAGVKLNSLLQMQTLLESSVPCMNSNAMARSRVLAILTTHVADHSLKIINLLFGRNRLLSNPLLQQCTHQIFVQESFWKGQMAANCSREGVKCHETMSWMTNIRHYWYTGAGESALVSQLLKGG